MPKSTLSPQSGTMNSATVIVNVWWDLSARGVFLLAGSAWSHPYTSWRERKIVPKSKYALKAHLVKFLCISRRMRVYWLITKVMACLEESLRERLLDGDLIAPLSGGGGVWAISDEGASSHKNRKNAPKSNPLTPTTALPVPTHETEF